MVQREIVHQEPLGVSVSVPPASVSPHPGISPLILGSSLVVPHMHLAALM